MNSRERILTALSNGQLDRVPVLETLIKEIAFFDNSILDMQKVLHQD